MRTTFAIVLIFILLVSCAPQPAPTSTPTSTASPIPSDTPTPTLTASPTAADILGGVDPAQCKLPSRLDRDVSLGFPLLEERLISRGQVSAAVLFVDFEDAPASITPEITFAMVDPGASDFYAAESYGKMQFELQPHLTWLRLPGTASDYRNDTFDGEKAILQSAAGLADADFDFSGMDMILVMTDPYTSPFAFGPAFTGGAQPYGVGGIEVDGVTINNGAVSAQDLLYWGALWLNHETGHLMSLADLYLYGSADAFEYVGDWGIMGNIEGSGQEFFGWERWQLGWVDNDQVACLPAGGEVALTAVEVEGGVKLAVVPLGATSAVVIESRRALGYDSALADSGALVYTIDTAIFSGEGTLKVQPEGTGDLMQAPLAAGESLTVNGVTITVLAADELTDTVQVVVN